MNDQLPLGLRLSDHTRLEDYIGEAAQRICRFNGLVYVAGPAGTGKSHLLEGLCHARNAEGWQTLYLTLGSDLSPAVLDGLEVMQLVCLDDADRTLAARDWQEALFHLINACRDRGTSLVLAGRTPVAGLELTLADLQSRLRGAYLLSTDRLTDEQKLEVIGRKAQRRGFTMSEEVCRFILGRAERDMHHLAKLVQQLDRETLRRQKKVTIPFVKESLGL